MDGGRTCGDETRGNIANKTRRRIAAARRLGGPAEKAHAFIFRRNFFVHTAVVKMCVSQGPRANHDRVPFGRPPHDPKCQGKEPKDFPHKAQNPKMNPKTKTKAQEAKIETQKAKMKPQKAKMRRRPD